METGIALYSIELHGCLNGVYTNDDLKGKIFNEIATLRGKRHFENEEEICGVYDCVYFGNNNKREGYELLISSKSNEKMREYEFTWRSKKGDIEFEGIGYKMNDRQIAVHYRYVGNK
jgi:hypothetical protein